MGLSRDSREGASLKALPVPLRSVIQADFVGMGMGFWGFVSWVCWRGRGVGGRGGLWLGGLGGMEMGCLK